MIIEEEGNSFFYCKSSILKPGSGLIFVRLKISNTDPKTGVHSMPFYCEYSPYSTINSNRVEDNIKMCAWKWSPSLGMIQRLRAPSSVTTASLPENRNEVISRRLIEKLQVFSTL